MSIDSMINVAINGRSDIGRHKKAPKSLRQLADASGTREAEATAAGSALGAIVTYIPAEIVTTYVAVLAVIDDQITRSPSGQWVTPLLFLGLTPLKRDALVDIATGAFEYRVKSASGPRIGAYLRTEPNAKSADNLDNLPDC